MTDSSGPIGAASDRTASSAARNAVVGHRRRRYLLYCLYAFTGPLSLATVADQLTRWERATRSTPRPDDPLDHRLRVYNALYHDHLPVLCDAGVVDYQQEEDLVELDAEGKALEPELESRYGDEITELLDDRETARTEP